jgi:hypothetical protein
MTSTTVEIWALKLRLELRQVELRKCMEKLHGPKAVRLLFQRDSAQRGVWDGDVISAATVIRACINVAKMTGISRFLLVDTSRIWEFDLLKTGSTGYQKLNSQYVDPELRRRFACWGGLGQEQLSLEDVLHKEDTATKTTLASWYTADPNGEQ